MKWTMAAALSLALLAGCGSPAIPAPPSDSTLGKWHAAVLQNVDGTKPGKEEVPDGLVLELFAVEGEPVPAADEPKSLGVYEYHGKATATVALFFSTGTFDPDAMPVYQRGADGVFSGTWTWRQTEDPQVSYPDAGHFKMTLPCESVNKTDPQGPAAVCGQGGIPGDLTLDCSQIDGNASLVCDTGGQKMTFQRQ